MFLSDASVCRLTASNTHPTAKICIVLSIMTSPITHPTSKWYESEYREIRRFLPSLAARLALRIRTRVACHPSLFSLRTFSIFYTHGWLDSSLGSTSDPVQLSRGRAPSSSLYSRICHHCGPASSIFSPRSFRTGQLVSAHIHSWQINFHAFLSEENASSLRNKPVFFLSVKVFYLIVILFLKTYPVGK